MNNIVKTLALICVFFVLTPGVLIRLPIKGGIYKIAALHALLFGAIYFIVTNVFGVLREGAGEGTFGYDPIYCPVTGPYGSPCTQNNSAPSVSDTGRFMCSTAFTSDGVRRKQRCTKVETTTTGASSYAWQTVNSGTAPSYTCPSNLVPNNGSCDSTTKDKCKKNKKARCKETPGASTTNTTYEYV